MKGGVEMGGIMLALTKHEDATDRVQRVLPKKCQDPGIFSVPCTIGNSTFADAMLDLRASINVMPMSIYRSLNFGDLELTGMSSTDPLYDLDPEIDLTLRRLRKARNIVVSNSSNSVSSSDNSSPITNIYNFVEFSSIDSFAEHMENNDRTLKELATPDVVYQPWCIQYPQLEPAQTYELKSGLVDLLPKFYGLAGEDPHKHLKEFHVVCSTMRP
ncbi:hypothetical protein CR513_45310, partial [Mucuna pruriens]